MCRMFNHLLNKLFRLIKILIIKFVFKIFLPKNWNYKPIITYFIFVSFATVLLIYKHHDRNIIVELLSEPSLVENETIQCRFPQLSLNIDGITFTLPKNPPAVCQSSFYPIKIDNYGVQLILSKINCTAIFYVGQGDKPHEKVPVKLIYNTNIPLLSDHFTIQCENLTKEKVYPSLPYASIHYDPNVRQRLANVKKRDDDFNVLVLGLDSISRLQFQRMLPETFNYITTVMNGIVLKGYNILGDGTPQQLIPMLTGYKELELPSTLHRDRNGSFVDVYPFIWNKYREQGYVTGYAEDGVQYGIWTLRLKGFEKTPTDHYLSPFYRMEAAKSLLYRGRPHCIRNQTTLDFFLSYIDQFWSSYNENKKFFFAFFKQYSHDGYNLGSLLDLSLLNFLKKFNQTTHSKQTIILLMTDHGARFSSARRTPQGKLEERLPFMSLIFPKKFQNKYSNELKILRRNIHRLTTPFDIYSTLLSFLNMNNKKPPSNIKQRSISLFHLIPAQRTCDDLNLEPHWCSCLRWHNINITEIQVIQAVKHIIHYINQQLSSVKNNLCQQLDLVSISNAQIYQPNQELLQFSKSSDADGRIPKYGDKKTDIMFYQITFETKPNKALYEATTQYSKRLGGFTTDLNHISRLNAYKSSALCIEKSYSHLRKFCQCIK